MDAPAHSPEPAGLSFMIDLLLDNLRCSGSASCLILQYSIQIRLAEFILLVTTVTRSLHSFRHIIVRAVDTLQLPTAGGRVLT